MNMVKEIKMQSGYKKSAIGIIPKDWEVRKLGELGELKNGINKDKEDFGFGFPMINLMDVFGINKVFADNFKLGLVNANERDLKEFSLKKGDVLFVRSSVKPEGVGLTTLICDNLENTTYSGFLIRFRDNGLLDFNYKAHCFFEERFRKNLLNKSTISANTNINQNALNSLMISVPPLPEQTAIANLLSTWDKAIQLNTQLLEQKQKRKKWLMQMLLTGKKRLKGFEGEWKEVKIGDLIHESRIPSANNDPNKRITVKLNLKGIEKRDVKGTESDDATFYFIRKKGQFIYGKQNLHKGALGIIPDELDNYESSQDIPTFDFTNHIFPKYFLYFLSQESFYTSLEKISTGTGSKRIHPEELYKIRISIPSIDEQIKISTLIDLTSTEIDLIMKKLEVLRTQKKGLMQILLTGKKRLKLN